MPLEINKISRRFGNKWALRDVSFEVSDGSVVGIFGASGSGKSTMLNIIAGTIKSSGGSVIVDDVDIKYLWLGVIPNQKGIKAPILGEDRHVRLPEGSVDG